MEASEAKPLESRPGVFVVGSPDVGKRTLLSRLLSVHLKDSPDSSSRLTVHGWTINTKYYIADVSVWIAHLHDEFSLPSLPLSNPLVALVMVIDMSEPSTFVALQDWVSRTDVKTFEILLCIGNKVDLVPHHPAHFEYKRWLLKAADTSSDPYSNINEFGISETEGTSLLGYRDPSLEFKRSCLEWCCENNIEFIEACASNSDFDKCLSADGDSQGVERLFDALSAHMWPGMILKSGDRIAEPMLPHNEELSEEESEYELEYEVLSAGSADPWEDVDERWVSASGIPSAADTGGSTSQENFSVDGTLEKLIKGEAEELQPSTSTTEPRKEIDRVGTNEDVIEKASGIVDKCYDFEDLEQLLSEIGNIRDNVRLMPDFQRREMAANLAMKMAAMFGGDSDDEGRHDS